MGKINKIKVVIRTPMGRLLITYKGKTKEYLINTDVDEHVMMKAIEDILKAYPSDSPVEFEELW